MQCPQRFFQGRLSDSIVGVDASVRPREMQCFRGNLRQIRKEFPPLHVGADAHIGPAGLPAFTEGFGKFLTLTWADRAVRPYNVSRKIFCKNGNFCGHCTNVLPSCIVRRKADSFRPYICRSLYWLILFANQRRQTKSQRIQARSAIKIVPAPLFSPFFSGKTEKNGPAEQRYNALNRIAPTVHPNAEIIWLPEASHDAKHKNAVTMPRT